MYVDNHSIDSDLCETVREIMCLVWRRECKPMGFEAI